MGAVSSVSLSDHSRRLCVCYMLTKQSRTLVLKAYAPMHARSLPKASPFIKTEKWQARARRSSASLLMRI